MALNSQSKAAQNEEMTFGAHRDTDRIIEEPKKEKRIQLTVPEDLHYRFKMACLKNETSITQVVIEQVEKWLRIYE